MQFTGMRQIMIAVLAIVSIFPSAFAQEKENSQEQNSPAATGQPAPHLPAVHLPAAHLPAVHLDGNYFSRDGHRFIPVGANWVPAKAAMQWPTQWDPKAIEADFKRMHELGFNTIRLDFVWAWIEPRPGDYDPDAFRKIDFLISLANRYHIYLHPSLLIGG
ncbi:MAG: beta-galactosidase, partial [Candidatus Sulfotelmatobacter sp.]